MPINSGEDGNATIAELARLISEIADGRAGDVAERLRAIARAHDMTTAQRTLARRAGLPAPPALPGEQLAIIPADASAVLTAPPKVLEAVNARLKQAASIRRIFTFWQEEVGKPEARLTPDRARKIQARIREGYTEQQIMQAIRGISRSPHHNGENDSGTEYLDLTLICRTGSKLEQFMGMASGDFEVTPLHVSPEVRRLEREADEALAEGRVHEYNEINKRLAKARKTSRERPPEDRGPTDD